MDEEELAEERRVVSELEVEDAGASRAPGSVTGKHRSTGRLLVSLSLSDESIFIVRHCGRI